MLADWNRRFPNCEPVGHHLRAAFPERWIRFHSLPESKRYPDDEVEYAEVLTRHNAVMSALATPGEAVVLLTTGYSETPEPTRSCLEVVAFDPDAQPWRTIAMHETDGDFAEPSYWHIYAGTWVWQPAVFNPLVRLVAEDAVANVSIVAADCRWLLHPYDGGMDVIAESTEARDRIRAAHAAWLSARPDGL